MLFNSLFRVIPIKRWSIGKVLSTRWFRLPSLVVGVLTLAPSVVHAQCFPSIPSGSHVPFKMSTHGKNHVVSYAEGNLYPQSSTVLLAVPSPKQLFSDRAWFPNEPLYEQPFAHDYADVIGVHIEKVLSFYFIDGMWKARYVPYVTLRLWSWGGGALTFTASCTLSSNLLEGSVNNDTMVFISLGTPVPN